MEADGTGPAPEGRAGARGRPAPSPEGGRRRRPPPLPHAGALPFLLELPNASPRPQVSSRRWGGCPTSARHRPQGVRSLQTWGALSAWLGGGAGGVERPQDAGKAVPPGAWRSCLGERGTQQPTAPRCRGAAAFGVHSQEALAGPRAQLLQQPPEDQEPPE